MKKLSPGGQRWLKAFHSIFACMWVGSAIILSAQLFFINPSNGVELYTILSIMEFIDIFILIPGAVGVLLTGLIYSVWTNWGWFKHNWISVKWLICLYGIIFGTYPLAPWARDMTRLSKEKGMAALTEPLYLHNNKMLLIFGTFQAATIIFAVFITALKPWKKKIKD